LGGASKEKDENKLKQRLSYWLGSYWKEFDNAYMKPRLIHGWPNVKDEHDEISKIVKNVIKDYTIERKNKDGKDRIEDIKRQLTDDYNMDGSKEIQKIDNSSKKPEYTHMLQFYSNEK